MKKYRLLIESPSIAKGSIIVQNKSGFYESQHELSMYRAIFPDFQVENRPEVWEEVTEKEEQEVNEYLPFQPKEGEEYWYVFQPLGRVMVCCAPGSGYHHNVFRTKKAAEYEKLRQESMNNRWKPQTNEQYFYYIFRNSEADYNTWTNYETDLRRYFIGNVHKTKEEAEEWGKKYGEAWRVLL